MPSFITPIIDTAIGIVVVYIAFSLLTSFLGEFVSSAFQMRSKMLVGAITQLFTATPGDAAKNTDSEKVTDPAAAAFFSHPIFKSLKHSATKDPQYLSAQQFSSVLLGLVNPDGPPQVPAPVQLPAGVRPSPPAPFDFTNIITEAKALVTTINAAGQVVRGTADTALSKQISAIAVKANGNYTTFVKGVEDWYDDHMDRVSGWYVKHTQYILVGLGLVVALMWNVDSVRIARALSCNSALRTSVSSLNPGTKDKADPALIKSVLEAVPLGWRASTTDDEAPEAPLTCDTVTGLAAVAQADADVAAADKKLADAQAASAAAKKASPSDHTAIDRAAADVTTATADKKTALAAKSAADKAASSPVLPVENKWLWILLKFLGLVLTAVALSQGANFWFDTLSSLTRVRNAGKKPDTSPDASRA